MHVLVFVVARKRYGTSKQTMPQNLKQNTKNDTGHPNVGMHGPRTSIFDADSCNAAPLDCAVCRRLEFKTD